MSDQQAMMAAQQNPELAQQVLAQNQPMIGGFNPAMAQQAPTDMPTIGGFRNDMPPPPQIMPGAQAAASSGMNAPNVPQSQDWWNRMKTGVGNMNPNIYQPLGMLSQAMQRPQIPPQQMMQHPMMAQQPSGMMAQKMPGILSQVRPSRIY